MSQKQRHTNTFEGGMQSDVDRQKQRSDSYMYAFNGRVVFNKDGTLAFENAKGTLEAISLGFNYGADTDYFVINGVEIDNKLVLFSTQNDIFSTSLYSEIGILTQNVKGEFSYQSIFNDQYDFNSDLLHFTTRYQIESHAILENENTVRVYWNDDFNEPRVFNVVAGASFNYLPSGAPLLYPYWYSVHGMDELCDLTWGIIGYQNNIFGNLLSGKREYAYRYIHRSGYVSGWSPLSGQLFLTVDDVNEEDWNQYQMRESGKQTRKGHFILISDLDIRFDRIEVACVYWETNEGAKEASIIFEGDIDSTSIPGFNHVAVYHTEQQGTPVALETLNERFFHTKHAKTALVKQNNYHKANIKLATVPEIDTSQISILPFVRRMISDEESTTKTTLPFTHQTPKTTSVDTNLFDGGTFRHNITNDYINYKGTQWEHVFKGHWRGGIYPYSIVLFDRKGQPSFAQFIGDFKFPEQYNNEWTLKRVSGTTTGTYGSIDDYTLTDYTAGSTYPITNDIMQGDDIVLKILGIMVSGIDLTDILYDEYGKLQISGFSIVRADRLQDILAQGLIMNCNVKIQRAGTPGDYDANSNITALHSTGNAYITKPYAGDFYAPIPSVAPFIAVNNQGHGDIASSVVTSRIMTQANLFTLECPENLFLPNLLDETTGYKIKLAGNCQMAGHNNPNNDFSRPVLTGTPFDFSYYSKNYYTYKGVEWYNDEDDFGRPGLQLFPQNVWGYEQPIQEIVAVGIDDRNKFISSGNQKISYNIPIFGYYDIYPPYAAADWYSKLHQTGTYLKMPMRALSSRLPMSMGGTYPYNDICYFIANIRKGIEDYTLTEYQVENRIFMNVGHFVPINDTTIAQAMAANSGRAVFNNVEVWGGDCYLDYFDYARLIPEYNQTDYTACAIPVTSYGTGLIFPLESNLNFTMRTTNRYASSSVKPERTECDNYVATGVPADYGTGFFIDDDDAALRRLEDFNLNKVMGAWTEPASINKYNVKDVCFVENDDFPLMEMHSETKIMGECFDNFRKFRVNNFQQADSKFGSITKLESLGLYIYCIQQHGFSRIRFNEREFVNTNTQQISVGTGQGYSGHDYIDTVHGSQHQWATLNNGRSIFFPDADKGKLLRFGQDGMNPISDLYGQHEYFSTKPLEYWGIIGTVPLGANGTLFDGNENNYDNPCGIGGIHGVYDYENQSAYWTFTQRLENEGSSYSTAGTPDTIEYSYVQTQFKGHHGFTPKIYCNYRQSFYSPMPDSPYILHQHNAGLRTNIYGAWQNSNLRFSVNPHILYPKVFDNNRLNVNFDASANILSATGTTEEDAQTVVLNDAVVDDRPEYREGYLVYPMMALNREERLRGKYLTLEYIIQNGIGNIEKLVRITSNECIYRISHKI